MITTCEQTRFNAELSQSARELIGPPNATISDELDAVNEVLWIDFTSTDNDTHDELFEYAGYLRTVGSRHRYER